MNRTRSSADLNYADHRDFCNTCSLSELCDIGTTLYRAIVEKHSAEVESD